MAAHPGRRAGAPAAGLRFQFRSPHYLRKSPTPSFRGRIHFVPVAVYIGPAPGWKGPALGADPTGAVAAPGGRA